ncbi:MAG: histidine ammonia-lyase, partial [Fimbriimonadaceae bacterium]|nr:histidine ammonia-lyase [Alphaproteobacteria bacterium]
MSASSFTLTPGTLTIEDLRAVYCGHRSFEFSDETAGIVAYGNKTITDIVARGEAVYGVNTGFGKLAQKRIASQDLEKLQRNLVRSHAAGTGPLLDDDIVRLVLLLKINSLARGHSGIRLSLLETMQALYNAEIYPVIPSQGSVGASGDLAPLAHMALVVMGEGEARIGGTIMSGADALASVGIDPVQLGPKEGLALLNGTQVSTAIALAALFKTERVFAAASIAGAMSVDAALGSATPFDARIHELRTHRGQIETAALYRQLLEGSEIRHSHEDCDRVQDPYSLRCQPQVMGACLDNMAHVSRRLLREGNAVSDNPLVFPDQGDVLSGGNFHAEPVAFAADILALTLAEIGNLAERRITLLIDGALSQLPPFLTENAGLNSGFMLAQVSSAALAAENKMMAHPASIDTIPTSANQEDHVSMATHGAMRSLRMTDNVEGIIAIELLSAAQGIDYRRPLKSSQPVEQV